MENKVGAEMDVFEDKMDRIREMEERLLRWRNSIPKYVQELHSITNKAWIKYVDSVPTKILNEKTTLPQPNSNDFFKSPDLGSQEIDSEELQKEVKKNVRLLQILFKRQDNALKKIIDEI